MLAIFLCEKSEIFFLNISPLSLPLVSINTKGADHFLLENKDWQEDLSYL